MKNLKPKRKKLTNSNGFARLMSFLAFILSGVGLLTELVRYYIVENNLKISDNNFFGKSVYGPTIYPAMFITDIASFISAYVFHIFLILVSLYAMIICFSGKSYKSIGAEFGATLFATSLPVVVLYVYTWITMMSSGDLSDFFALDGDYFWLGVLCFLYYAIPLLSSIMLLLSAITMWVKVGAEKYQIVCVIAENKNNHTQTAQETLDSRNNQNFGEQEFNQYYNHNAATVPQADPRQMAENFTQDINNQSYQNNNQSDFESVENFNNNFAPINDNSFENSNAQQNNVPEPKVCPNCLQQADDNSKFCRLCGTKMQ